MWAGFMQVEPADVVIIEGILVLHEKSLREMLNMKIFVDTDDDVRLARRYWANALPPVSPTCQAPLCRQMAHHNALGTVEFYCLALNTAILSARCAADWACLG